MRFATNVFHLEEWEFIQARTIVESVQAWQTTSGNFRAVSTDFIRDTRSTAPHNSSFGRDTVFTGATLVLEERKETAVPLEDTLHKYTQAANAFSEASEKPAKISFLGISCIQHLGILILSIWIASWLISF